MLATLPSQPPVTAAVSSAPSHPIRRVDPLDDPQWDAKLARCPGASFFHGQSWARVLHDTYGFTPSYFTQETEQGLRCLLPFMEIDSWLTGRRGVSLPFTDECGPLAPDAESARQLMRAAKDLAIARDWKHWEVRGGIAVLNAPAAVAFHGHTVDLDAESTRLLGRCDSAVRRAIRKAESSGLTVSFAHTPEAMRGFYTLLCQTRRRHGLPPQPLRFFENIQRHVLRAHQGCVVLASLDGRPVSGAVFFHFGHTALFKFGASDEAFQHLRPNNLVMWRAIEWHARMGFSTLDLGRTSLDNEGLRRFKLSWGARERRIEYTRFDRKAGAFVTTTDQSSGWHSRVFKLVPGPFARVIGAAAYRHVA